MHEKKIYMFLSLLISGPKQPGNDIDVYLAPLIGDLKLLWNKGVKAFDAYREEIFTVRCALLWIINDFPAYGNLSGYSVKGYQACPICEEKTCAEYLNHSKKVVYLGHRRFLPRNHIYRRWKRAFNGRQEFEITPEEPVSGIATERKLAGMEFRPFGKGRRKRKSGSTETFESGSWKKKSIFFQLDYWKHLLVRHNLDVMHIEKNVCDSIVGTILNLPGKTKDGVKSRSS